jgi:hypothetical protein
MAPQRVTREKRRIVFSLVSKRYLLWDASALVPYYVPEGTRSSKVAERVRIIVEAVRNHRTEASCFIPNIVIAEVFATIDKLHYSTWDRGVRRMYGGNGRSLHGKRHSRARRKLRDHIHNGTLF